MSSPYDLKWACSANADLVIWVATFLQDYEVFHPTEPVWSDSSYLLSNADRLWVAVRQTITSSFWKKPDPGPYPLFDVMESYGWQPCDAIVFPWPSPYSSINDLKAACSQNMNLVAQAAGWLMAVQRATGWPVWSNTAYLLDLLNTDRLWFHFSEYLVAIGAPAPSPLPLWNAMEAVSWISCDQLLAPPPPPPPPPLRYRCVLGKCVGDPTGPYTSLLACQAACNPGGGGDNTTLMLLIGVAVVGAVGVGIYLSSRQSSQIQQERP